MTGWIGTATCKNDCTGFDITTCNKGINTPACGNNIIEGDEVCDSNSRSCQIFNTDWTGVATCKNTCDGYDTGTCIDTSQPDSNTIKLFLDKPQQISFNDQKLSLVLRKINPESGGYVLIANSDYIVSIRLSEENVITDYVAISGLQYSKEYILFSLIKTNNKYVYKFAYDPIMGCRDSDYGNNIFIKGTCYDERYTQGITDRCDQSGNVEDFSCKKNMCIGTLQDCLNGCSEGACSPVIAEDTPMPKDVVNSTIIDETKLSECSGCLININTCIPIGTRLVVGPKQVYCYIDGSLKSLNTDDASCMNNYECASNLCIDSQCISQGFFQKMMRWFKKLFG
jgi:hypothetical protein